MGLKNNIKNSVKAFICGALIANLSVGALISANAGSSNSSLVYNFSDYGHTYNAWNNMTTGSDSNGKYATAATSISCTTSVSGVTMGVQPRVYDSAGNLKTYGEWKYNSDGVSAMMFSQTYRIISGSPAFYSQGYVQVWMGTGYHTYGTYRTPNLNDYT